MGELNGPQLSLVVAEPGATRESVVAAMTASAEQINYEVILRPGRILTYDSSRRSRNAIKATAALSR